MSMRIYGHVSFIQLEYCFAIPVLEQSGDLFFQTLGEGGNVAGYERLNDRPHELVILSTESQKVISGDEPIFVYLFNGGHSTSGTKSELQPLLMELLTSPNAPLFSKLEIAVFLKDRDLFKRYIERIQDEISHYHAGYKGKLVLEGLNPGEPSIVIMSKPGEQEVVRAIKLGLPNKDHLLASIVETSSPVIRAMVYSLGGGEELAKDIIQDTFVAFLDHVHAGTIRVESKISTFVYAIARNLTLSVLRKSARTMIGRLEAQTEDSSDLGFDAPHETVMILEERLLFTHELVSKLEAESSCIKLLRARFQPGFRSNSELAAQLGYKDASVVSAQIHNCKKHLVKLIATDPVLLCKAMDLLDDVHQLEPLVALHADRLKDIFQFLQGQMKPGSEDAFKSEMAQQPSLARLVMALKPRFSH